MTERLLIFTRYPESGLVKTRLIAALGADGASRLHREMTIHTLTWARELRRYRGVEIEVRFAGGDEARMLAMFGDDLRYVPQGDGDLGQRLATAFRSSPGFTIAVGTDCPGLTAIRLEAAFATLLTHEVVLGPATDGGYYLIGSRQPQPLLFQGIAWGTETVCADTCRIATDHGLTIALLDPLSDVDGPADLAIWRTLQYNTA